MSPRGWLLVLPLLLLLSAQAQRQGPPSTSSGSTTTSGNNNNIERQIMSGVGNLAIYVLLPNDHPLSDLQLRVQLLGSAGIPVADQYTGNEGRTQFNSVAPGTYQVLVTGTGVEDTLSSLFEVEQSMHTEYVRVKLQPSSSAPSSPQATVSAQALNVPSRVSKEFDKGNEEMERQQWRPAEEHFRKAIAAWPAYGAAYNNLGLACAHRHDYNCARDAWEKAARFDPGSARPLLNLARLCTTEHDFSRAAALFRKASSLEPLDPEALVLLANADLMLGDFDQALAHARQALSRSRSYDRNTPPAVSSSLVPIPNPVADVSVAHLIAANALEAEHRQEEAVAEYRAVLRENANGSAAKTAQKALTRLQQPPAANDQ
jgi:tetratricopeptide (TPR) repeat protein